MGSKAAVPRYGTDVGALESPWVYATVAGERKEPVPSLKSNASALLTGVSPFASEEVAEERWVDGRVVVPSERHQVRAAHEEEEEEMWLFVVFFFFF